MLPILLICCGLWEPSVIGSTPTVDRTSLSKYMNSVPPSNDYFCVGNGPTNLALHPDRAPHTDLARQGSVLLFSGAAPQQGLNFTIPVGALLYRNQMSTLGSPEPSPQVGTAGTLQQEPWDFFLPWSEARWHPGEDITWQGFRAGPATWIGGLPFWDLPLVGPPSETIRAGTCGSLDSPPVHKPKMVNAATGGLTGFSPKAAFNLQLSRGIYQASKIRPDVSGMTSDECPFSFREPWFQARGIDPVFNVALNSVESPYAANRIDCAEDPTHANCQRLAETFFPNFLNIYNYQQLELDGGRMVVDFERSATWPREPTDIKNSSGTRLGGAITGTSMASDVRDEYGNRVHFDRVPKYGWETDYKIPNKSTRLDASDPSFSRIPKGYKPVPNAWRLPHKRLRTVELYEADDAENSPSWTIAYVYEHPESDRIDRLDTGEKYADGEPWSNAWREWKSLYSFLPQADWVFGRLPDLNDETTLLTVQAYKRDVMKKDGTDELVQINGAAFRDDYSVWRSTLQTGDTARKAATERAYTGALFYEDPVYEWDSNHDGWPGRCQHDDDGDGIQDEDCFGKPPGLGYGFKFGLPCPDLNGNGVPDFKEDDDEIAPTRGAFNPVSIVDPPGSNSAGTDPPGDATPPLAGQEPCPGICGVDDDLDGLIDEDSNGYQAYLAMDVNVVACFRCQKLLREAISVSNTPPGFTSDEVAACLYTQLDEDAGLGRNYAPRQTWDSTGGCKNPLYWEPTLAANCDTGADNDCISSTKMDRFAEWDDDEDGLIDEDGGDDPLLVDLRGVSDTTCASGKYPYVPLGATLPNRGGPWATDCRPVINAGADPWTYQVQFVYARTNPFWLLVGRNADGSRSYLQHPRYHYYTPFAEPFDDKNGDGVRDPGDDGSGHDIEPFVDINHNGTLDTFVGGDDGTSVLPNVHPDCVPNPKFRGPQGKSSGGVVDPVKPSDIHLIKRIVRMRGDISDPETADPSNYVERIWLYRYSDAGFLKAVFDPASVQEIIDADTSDAITEPDNILQYADTHDVAGQPLIMYASQWYTFYNPYVEPVVDGNEIIGIPACYDTPPVIVGCDDGAVDLTDPDYRLPLNGCDGEIPWTSGYNDEMEVDPDCSSFIRRDCGWCYARDACGGCDAADASCNCSYGQSFGEDKLRQLGISGAQPRFRKYLIKTARMRGNDGAMHLYRFDYLGAASSVYGDNDQITSYADPHNITIVDEIVEQTSFEAAASINRNEFYIYEDGFRLNLDPAPQRPGTYAGGDYRATSHYLYTPVKIKTRRVVVMNYYGIALSDRLILTPGYVGDQASFVDNQQYELLNSRGQTKHIFDPSWVAALRSLNGDNLIKDTGRVLVELFGGEGGWYSVLRGIAKGSGGGNLYNQQCLTPEDVLDDVPVQRVAKQQLVIVSMTEHRKYDSDLFVDTNELELRDMPIAEASYYRPFLGSDPDFALNVTDPAGTIGDLQDTACNTNAGITIPCECGTPACPGGSPPAGFETCFRMDSLPTIDLHNQKPVMIQNLAGAASDVEGDGVSMVRYHYTFYDKSPEEERRVKWKYRWLEKVSAAQGGSGQLALELWYFDVNGRIRFHGRGRGQMFGALPDPEAPFVFTYFGFDTYGRPNIQIENIDMDNISDTWPFGMTSSDAGAVSELAVDWPDVGIGSGENLVTVSTYNDFGALTSKQVGLLVSGSTLGSDPSGWDAEVVWKQVQRTDYKLLANRTIRDTTISDVFVPDWQDPYSYLFQYNSVSRDGATVLGTTTVSVRDKSGRPLEQRVIGWNPQREIDGGNMTDKIGDIGWGISLADYTHDGAIAAWGGTVPDDNWTNCGTVPCLQYIDDNRENFVPPPPTDTAGALDWPPAAKDQIVTLSRNFRLYQQATTLKPTHDIVYSSFDQAPPADSTDPDRREVIRQYTYDLEDRIARQKEPDGTITRFLFDAKRRPTKIFRGSADGCSDWFPRVFSTSDDDMVLTEQRLYNDGTDTCEHTENPITGACDTETYNEDFPYDANMLVRVRKFTDTAEDCTINHPTAASRDSQYVYDWRGRAVLVRSLAVGSGGSTVSQPKVVSVTTTVFDNLSRAVLVATWDEFAAPALSEVEAWQETDAGSAVGSILGRGEGQKPLTLSQTLYDERGRVYEQRSYDPSTIGTKYTSTKTHRDDLDRVVKVVTPRGTTTNFYDSLGRVRETSFWSKAAAGGVELTRTESTYDVFGNVTTQTHYDRKPGTTGGINLSANAVFNYTHNWYDDALRLIATANYGTNGTDGYSHGATPTYVSDSPPTWEVPGDPAPPEYRSGIDNLSLTGVALVTLFQYDAAGRRDYVRNPNGIISKSWFDLLGRRHLVAENWHEPGDESYEGPSRYTAHHYTRGGLQDMMVAVIPADDTVQLTPDSILWIEDSTADFAATGVDTTAGLYTVQATRFVYGADVVNESDHIDISDAPNLVKAIQYPNTNISNFIELGQPNPADALTFTYTIDGQVAQRTDQRGVSLDFLYDETSGCGSCSSAPGNQPTEVRVSYADTSALDDPADTVDYLSFGYDTAGRLIQAQTYGPWQAPALMSDVSYTYDARGNLTSETLDPAPGGGMTKSVSYGWDWTTTGVQRDQLNSITYPTGSRKFDYTYDTGTWYDDIGRMTGLALNGGDPIIHYDTTGGGRNIIQTWGDGKVMLDYHPSVDNPNPSLLDRFGRIKTMDIRKIAGQTTSTIHKYEYGHDANGNRTYALIEQAGHPGDRSYLYGYDRLNRLIYAERGVLNGTNDGILDGGKGRAWGLDLLGNWSGDLDSGTSGNQSVVDYTTQTVGQPAHGYTPGTDVPDAFTQHDTDESNAIKTYSYDDDGDPATAPENSDFHYDDAGNLVLDDKKFYKYDAWNRIVAVWDKGELGIVGSALNGTPGDLVATYEYDALGRRIAKTLGTATSPTDYFYYDGHRVIEHYADGVNGMALNKQYVYGLNYIDEPVAYYENDGTGSPTATPHFILRDANYDVVGITDDQGTLVQQMTYDPYGIHLYIEDGNGVRHNGIDADISELLIALGRNGLWLDPETGLYYNRMRYYDVFLGRFRQRDPDLTGLGLVSTPMLNAASPSIELAIDAPGQFSDGMHLFQSLRSNPSRYRDALGTRTWMNGGVYRGFRTTSRSGSFLRQRQRWEYNFLQDLLGINLKRQYVREVSIDFEIFFFERVNIKLMGRDAYTGEGGDGTVVTYEREGFRWPVIGEMMSGYDERSFDRIDATGYACRMTEICYRECFRYRDGQIEIKRLESPIQYQSVYGVTELGSVSGVLRCNPIPYNRSVSLRNGTIILPNPKGPLTCTSKDVKQCP